MTGCPDAAEWVEFLADRLPPLRDAEVSAHAEKCAACCALLSSLSLPNDTVVYTPEDEGTNPPVIAGPQQCSRERSFSTPRRVGDYELLGEIGRGGRGVVYKARQRSLDRVVALKMILSGVFAREDEVERFRREACAAADLQDSHIVQVYEIGEWESGDDSVPLQFYSLEYCEGGSLELALAGKPLPAGEAANLVAVLAQTMDAAHRRGIVHRDLKPANVLLKEIAQKPNGEGTTQDLVSRTPKIADFGFAKKCGESGETQSGTVMGSPSYMAPEQASGKSKEVRPTADIYSLGAILYECLTGRPPYRAAFVMETLIQVMTQDPVSPRALNASVPRDLETICLKCLQKDQGKRYNSALDLAADLKRFLNNEPIRARPVSLPERGWRWCKRNKSLAALYALLFVVFMVVAPIYIVQLNGRLNAEAREKRAVQETIRVERRGRAKQLLADARSAAKVGDWGRGLPLFAEALNVEEVEDRLAILVERLPGYLAVNDTRTFERELDALESQKDLGSHAAAVHLLRGEWLMCQSDRLNEGRKRIETALQMNELNVEDAEYARALLAPGFRPFEAALLRALNHNPRHHRARRVLLIARAMQGQVEATREDARLHRSLFPEDPLPDFAEALLALLRGERATVDTHMARLKERLAPPQFLGAERQVQQIKDLMDLLELPLPLMIPRMVAQVKALLRPADGPAAFPVPVLGLSLQFADPLLKGVSALFFAQSEEKLRATIRSLEEARQVHVESLLPTVETYLRTKLIAHFIQQDRVNDFREECSQVARVGQLAASSPTLIPRSPLRYQALAASLIADVAFLHLADEPEVERLKRIEENLRRLCREGLAWKEERNAAIEQVLQMLTCRPSPGMLATWNTSHDPQGTRYKTRKEHLARYGRWLVAEWQLREPDHTPALYWAAVVESWIGNHELARAWNRKLNGRKLTKTQEDAIKQMEDKARNALGSPSTP